MRTGRWKEPLLSKKMHSGTNGKDVVDCAHQILEGCDQEEHKREATTLVERAELADKKR